MFSGKEQIYIPVSRSKVFSIAETYPHFVEFFSPESRTLEKRDNFVRVEVYTKLLGFYRTRWEGEGIVFKDQKIDFTQTVGLFQGMKAVWEFFDKGDGTIVTIETTFTKDEYGPLLEKIMGYFIVCSTTKKILKQLQNKSLAS